MKYYQLIRDMSKFNLRIQIVKKAKGINISESARIFGTTRKTVRKWVNRYEEKGLRGLKDLSRAPKNIPHKMKTEDEERIIEIRKRHRRFGSRRIKDRYKVEGGYTAIHRVIKQNGLVVSKKKRWRKRKDLSELKKKLKFFEFSQIDTKDLSDIYQYWPYMKRLGLPRYEYTLRELSTGAVYYAYADENTSTNASLFAKYVIEHLKSYGIDTANIMWQTDNGSEYIGSARKKINRLSAFEKELKKNKIEHMRIPPRCCYLQADVETFHRIVEDELYDIEGYGDEIEFPGKTYAYQLYFNYYRRNRYRENKSPVDILKERFPDIDENILNLPPIRLEILSDLYYKEKDMGGYHVPEPARFLFFTDCFPSINYL